MEEKREYYASAIRILHTEAIDDPLEKTVPGCLPGWIFLSVLAVILEKHPGLAGLYSAWFRG